jgi:hypothetical protein
MAFSATDACVEGFRIAKRHPGALAIWGVFTAVVFTVIGLLVFLVMGASLLSMGSNFTPGATQDPAAMARMIVPILGVYALALPLILFMAIMIVSAVYRAVLRPEDKGVGFLKLGGDEFRLLAVMVIYILLVAVAELVVFGVLFVVAGLLFKLNHALGGIFAFLCWLAVICLFIWVGTRLSLSYAITFAEKRISLFDSWKLTKGHFWGLIGMRLLTALIGFGLMIGFEFVIMIVLLITMGGALAMGGQGHSAADALAAAPLAIVGGLVMFVLGVFFYALYLTVLIAPTAAAYKALVTPDPTPAPPPLSTPEPEAVPAV